jgi:predicted kinase
MSKMLILRGLPGSGKSFITKFLNCVILSTDDIFMDRLNTEYLWTHTVLSSAHKINQEKARLACFRGCPQIVIDNTNTTTKEVKPYYNIAMEYGYEVELLIPTTKWAFDVDECFERNTHGVPREVIQNMKNRFQSNEDVLKRLVK